MPGYVYGKVFGAKETTLPDGTKVYEPVVIDPKELYKYNPSGFKGWFVTRGNDRVATLICPGDPIRLEVVEDQPVASPVTLRA